MLTNPEDAPIPDYLITAVQAAKEHGVTRQRIYQIIEDDRLVPFREINGTAYFLRAEVADIPPPRSLARMKRLDKDRRAVEAQLERRRRADERKELRAAAEAGGKRDWERQVAQRKNAVGAVKRYVRAPRSTAPDWLNKPTLLTVHEAAEILEMTYQQVLDVIRRDARLPQAGIPRHPRVWLADVVNYQASIDAEREGALRRVAEVSAMLDKASQQTRRRDRQVLADKLNQASRLRARMQRSSTGARPDPQLVAQVAQLVEQASR
jgi:hypothetical protein